MQLAETGPKLAETGGGLALVDALCDPPSGRAEGIHADTPA
jgi:hypothetical protein